MKNGLLHQLALALCTLLVNSCGTGSSKEHSSDLNLVFGQDDRVAIGNIDSRFQNLARAVGQFGGCTGTLISNYLVLTAAHCIFDSRTQSIKPEVSTFKLGMNNGSFAAESYIEHMWYLTQQPEQERARDLAVVKLRDPLGQRFGAATLAGVNFDSYFQINPSMPVSLIGYSHDLDQGRSATAHINCQIRQKTERRLMHDCDMSTGASGGPIVHLFSSSSSVAPSIVAVMTSEYRNGISKYPYVESFQVPANLQNIRANVGTSVEPIVYLAEQLKATIDQGQQPPRINGVFEARNTNPVGQPQLGRGPDNTPSPGGNPGGAPGGNQGQNPGGTPPGIDQPPPANQPIPQHLNQDYLQLVAFELRMTSRDLFWATLRVNRLAMEQRIWNLANLTADIGKIASMIHDGIAQSQTSNFQVNLSQVLQNSVWQANLLAGRVQILSQMIDFGLPPQLRQVLQVDKEVIKGFTARIQGLLFSPHGNHG